MIAKVDVRINVRIFSDGVGTLRTLRYLSIELVKYGIEMYFESILIN